MDDPKPNSYDPGRALTYGALFGVLTLTLFICIIIGWQVYLNITVSTEFVGALTFIMGWLTGQAGQIFNNRFGSTQQSAAKDATIAQQARTAAVTQDALLDPNVIVTSSGTPSPARAAMVDPAAPVETTGAKRGVQPAGPEAIQAETVNVTALTAAVSEVQPTEKDKP